MIETFVIRWQNRQPVFDCTKTEESYPGSSANLFVAYCLWVNLVWPAVTLLITLLDALWSKDWFYQPSACLQSSALASPAKWCHIETLVYLRCTCVSGEHKKWAKFSNCLVLCLHLNYRHTTYSSFHSQNKVKSLGFFIWRIKHNNFNSTLYFSLVSNLRLQFHSYSVRVYSKLWWILFSLWSGMFE